MPRVGCIDCRELDCPGDCLPGPREADSEGRPITGLARPEQAPWDDTCGRFPAEPEAPASTTVVHVDSVLLPLCRDLLRLRKGGGRGVMLLDTWRRLRMAVALLDDAKG